MGICVFGLPGHTHGDNPGRGVQSALELHARFRAGGQRVCIGITTGNLLCTCVGALRVRLEYTVSGAFSSLGGFQGFGALVLQKIPRYLAMP